MRTIEGAIAEIRAMDPGTSLTRNALRQMVKRGTIPSVHAGRKVLVNLDALMKTLERTESAASEPAPGGLRKIL
jgi:excisionase family DNA binding protein